tara:strand:+ start:1174 stop:2397 length:1224 start_codon:yes stop_codon:yes gene_type:complete
MILNKPQISFLKIILIIFINTFLFVSKVSAESEKLVKVGILLGFTGAIESITPSMADAIELAFNEISDHTDTNLEIKFKLQRADTNCNNINISKTAAKNLINDGVTTIIGAACPGITKEIAKEITIPNKILLISPADNSNGLLNLKNRSFVFRTTPSKIRGSKILAEITKDRGIRKVAISFNNNLDNEVFAKFFKKELDKNNIETTIAISHDENSVDYTDHISALTAAGGDAVAIISNINSGGDRIINSMLDTGMFNKFIFPEYMVDQKIIEKFKKESQKKSFGYLQVLSSLGSKKFLALAQSKGINASSPYVAESYDAAAITILSHFAKFYNNQNSLEKQIYSVSNEPGLKIYPGEIKKAIEMLRHGKSINYEGATRVEFDDVGSTLGSFVEVDFGKGKLKSKKMR